MSKTHEDEDQAITKPFLLTSATPTINGSPEKHSSQHDVDINREKNGQTVLITLPLPAPSCEKSKEPLWKRFRGIAYTVFAVNCFSLTSTLMKKYSHIHPFNTAVWQSPAAALVAIGCILYTKLWEKKPVLEGLFPICENKKNIVLLVIRAVKTTIILYLTVYSFRFITAADLRTVVSSVVIATFIFGWIFLGEKCGVVPVITAFIAVCGIVGMTRPPLLTGKKEFDKDNLIGIGIAVLTMLLIAFQLIIIRTLKVHHGVANAFAIVWTLVQGFILSVCFGYWEVAETNEILGLSLVGLSLGTGLTCLVLALQVEEAGVVALIRTSEVIFVFLWQYIIVGTLPDWIR